MPNLALTGRSGRAAGHGKPDLHPALPGRRCRPSCTAHASCARRGAGLPSGAGPRASVRRGNRQKRWRCMMMARIAHVELRMVDLVPKVKRTDAIQSFVSQETPIVTITDADGAIGTGYSYTIGTGGPAVISLLARHSGAAPDRARGRRDRSDLARSAVRHPCHDGRRDHRRWRWPPSTPRCGICAASGRACRCGGWPAAPSAAIPLYTTEGGWLHIEPQAWSTMRCQVQANRVSPAPRSRSASRIWREDRRAAVGGARGGRRRLPTS